MIDILWSFVLGFTGSVIGWFMARAYFHVDELRAQLVVAKLQLRYLTRRVHDLRAYADWCRMDLKRLGVPVTDLPVTDPEPREARGGGGSSE